MRVAVDEGYLPSLDRAIAGDRAADHPALAVRVARARLGSGPMPSLDEIRESEDPSVSLSASLLARHGVSLLDLRLSSAAAQLARVRARDARAELEAELALAWSSHLSGEPIGDSAHAIEARAARAGLCHTVLDAASLAASAALVEQGVAAALPIARRASRMARTEGLPHEEYLAHLVLAKVRRHGGRPHLAARIASAIARAAPAAWRPWLSFELFFSGAVDVAARLEARGVPGEAVLPSLRDLEQSARRGDRDAFHAALATAHARFGAGSPFALEVDALGAALDPFSPPPMSVAPFLGGHLHQVPGLLSGLSGEVRVIAFPDGTACRLLGQSAMVPDLVEIGRDAGAKQHRRESALCHLAFAGHRGLSREDLFRAVWGFVFTPHLHRGVFDVLLHRLRADLGDVGALVRDEQSVTLSVTRPISVADPRVEASLEDAVLRALALRGEARARELAADLNTPLRTVQQALSRLLDEEECTRVGEGQAVSYRVEDTTFREPTRI